MEVLLRYQLNLARKSLLDFDDNKEIFDCPIENPPSQRYKVGMRYVFIQFSIRTTNFHIHIWFGVQLLVVVGQWPLPI